jgi:DNA-binding PadR family transcriptional regulator
METPILDLYILSLLERGLETPYHLHSQGGISLGASSPALKRLIENKLIRRITGPTTSKRRSHRYSLTEAGLEQAHLGWRPYFKDLRVPPDIDAVLRLVDLATQYKMKQAQITAFLERAARNRSDLARQAGARMVTRQQNPLTYAATRSTCDYARLEAEAKAMSELAQTSVGVGRKHGAMLRRQIRGITHVRSLFDPPAKIATKGD